MNRIIKFRAWDKEKERMTDEFIIKSDGSLRIWDGSGWGENQYTINLGSSLMQFTGLKDKNGIEIYEGDIVKVDWGFPEPYLKENKYDEPFVVEWRFYSYPPFDRYLPMPKDIEILGNIYENPNLLESIDN